MSSVHNNEGFVLVICLMMLAVLSFIGIMATNTANVELQVAANDRLNKVAFYRSDSGVYSSPKVIRKAISESPSKLALSTINFSESNARAFQRKIFGFEPKLEDNKVAIDYPIGKDNGGNNLGVTILRSGQENLPGGSVEFASGYEGIGHGSAGGVAILYTLDSNGKAPGKANANVQALYRFIPGTAGGL